MKKFGVVGFFFRSLKENGELSEKCYMETKNCNYGVFLTFLVNKKLEHLCKRKTKQKTIRELH